MLEVFSGVDTVILNWVIIPVLIFLARILDVSLGTLRIVSISRGDKLAAPILGFVEVLIWLVAITQVMQNLSNFVSYIAWAAGFACGNYIGLKIEEKIAIGQVMIRIITSKLAAKLTDELRNKGFRVTCIDAEGNKGKVNIIFLMVRRKDIELVVDIIRLHNPNAFYSIENIKSISEVDLPVSEERRRVGLLKYFPLRKGK